MAFGSILIAGAALWFTQQERILGVESDDNPAVHSTQMVNQLQKVDEALQLIRQQAEDNTRLQELLADRDRQLDAFDARMQSILAIQEDPTNVADPISDVADSDVNPADVSPSLPDSDESASTDPNNFDKLIGVDDPKTVADAMEDAPDIESSETEPIAQTPPADDPADESPLLKVVQVSQKPLESQFDITVTLKNVGTRPAIVSELNFRPTQIVGGISRQYVMNSLGQSTEGELVVTLTDDHNQSAETGAQGQYVYRLPKPFTIPADKTASIRMAIFNNVHVGFALQGTLMVTFNESEKLEIPEVQLAFIGADGDQVE